jgi:hypothetical protein
LNYRQRVKSFVSSVQNKDNLKSPLLERKSLVSVLMPFLGVHLSDLTFQEDGGEKINEKKKKKKIKK